MKKPDFRKLYNDFFYIPKHEKLSDKVFRCRIATSVLTIFACVTVMTASTFALFSSQVSTGSFTIESAYFSVTVNEVTYDEAYICPLAFEDTHIFVIEPAGTASTGYCEIRIGEDEQEQVYYTGQLTAGSTYTLTVQAAVDTPIVFTPYWGNGATAFSERISEKGAEIYHSTTPYAVYVVEEGATLTGIAEYYGVEEEDILIYNNLSEIPAGFWLKIPGVDPATPAYEAPVEEEAADEQTEEQSKEPSEESGEASAGDGNESSSEEDTSGNDGNESGSESDEEPSGDSDESVPGEGTSGTDSNISGSESGGESDSSSEPAAVSEVPSEAPSDSGGESSAGDSTSSDGGAESSGGDGNSSADTGSTDSGTGE